MLKIAYSPLYKYQLPEGHRFPMVKYELIAEQLLYEGLVEKHSFFQPDKLKDQDILLTHTKEYLNKLHKLELGRKEARAIGFPISKALIDRGKHIANGTLVCANHAIEDGVSLNVAGGTHHSFDDHGEGFCVFNDIAIAANVLLHRKVVERILIVDLDVHQGNGTASIFRELPEVFTFSMHGANNYPIRKTKSDLDVGLPDGTDDKEYLTALEKFLPEVIQKSNPDLIFYLAGVDVLITDKLGKLSMTREGVKRRDAIVMNHCKSQAIPLVITMGGGYSPKLVDIVEAHCNTFRLAQEMYF
jgi:acetoin utilization deacetylase AcuC-like enzyme